MYFRAILKDKSCYILEGKDLIDIKKQLETDEFIECYYLLTGNKELLRSSLVDHVRISKKSLDQIVTEAKADKEKNLNKLRKAMKE